MADLPPELRASIEAALRDARAASSSSDVSTTAESTPSSAPKKRKTTTDPDTEEPAPKAAKAKAKSKAKAKGKSKAKAKAQPTPTDPDPADSTQLVAAEALTPGTPAPEAPAPAAPALEAEAPNAATPAPEATPAAPTLEATPQAAKAVDESKPANWVRWDNIDAIMKQYGLTRSDAEQALQEVCGPRPNVWDPSQAETQLPEAHIADVSIFAPETIEDDTLDAVPMDAKPADTKEAAKPADTKVTKPADTKPRTLTDALLVRSESDQSLGPFGSPCHRTILLFAFSKHSLKLFEYFSQTVSDVRVRSCPTLMLGQSVVNKQIGSNVPKDLAALPSPEEVESDVCFAYASAIPFTNPHYFHILFFATHTPRRNLP